MLKMSNLVILSYQIKRRFGFDRWVRKLGCGVGEKTKKEKEMIGYWHCRVQKKIKVLET